MTQDISQIREFAEHPVIFSETILGDELWETQIQIMDALAQPRAHVAVKGCHGSSKTWTASRILLWWLLHDADARAVTTAPTWVQVVKQVWAEIAAAARNSRVKLFDRMNQAEIRITESNYAIGVSTNETDRFQGWHGKVLIIVDEAPGVFADLWQAIEGIEAAGDVRVLQLGNPTIVSGPFYESFFQDRWKKFTISAFDTPNLKGVTIDDLLEWEQNSSPELDYMLLPYMISRRWVLERYHEWGPDHPMWYARVLGEFPPQSESALISIQWLESAKYRFATKGQIFSRTTPFKAGLDVAGAGRDETVLTVRQGDDIVLMQGWSDPDPRDNILEALQPYYQQLDQINVDSAGIGYYLALQLKDKGFRVQMINVAERSTNPTKYHDLKAELYWGLRQRFETGQINNLRWEKAYNQLAGIRWGVNSKQQTEIESKSSMEKRGVHSPDWAESVMLAFAPWIRAGTPSILAQGSTSGWGLRNSGIYAPKTHSSVRRILR